MLHLAARDLTGADLSDTNLTDAVITEAIFSQVDLSKTTVQNVRLNPAIETALEETTDYQTANFL